MIQPNWGVNDKETCQIWRWYKEKDDILLGELNKAYNDEVMR